MASSDGHSRRTPTSDVELLLQIGLQIAEEQNLDTLLRLAVDRIAASLDYAYCCILLKERQDLVIRAVTSYSEDIVGSRIPIGTGVTGRCAARRAEMNVPDISQCPHYIHVGDEVFKSELDVPIVFRGRLLGVLNTQSQQTNAFGDTDLHILRTLATQIGVAVHNAQIRGQLELVQDIGVQLLCVTRSEELVPWVVEQIRNRLHHDSCAILRVDGFHLVFEAATGRYSSSLVGLRIPIGMGITGRCARERQPINVGDVRAEPDYIPSGIEDVRSEIAAPIMSANQLYGVLTIESSTEDAFDDDDVRLLTALSAQIAVGIRQARLLADAERMAVTDALTGLYNYRYFQERLTSEVSRATRYGRPLTLIMVDLDDFKTVNDRYGHLKGDDVLRAVAGILKANIRRYDEPVSVKDDSIDIATRYGGEEFMVIMPETGAEGGLVAAERLRAAIEADAGRSAGVAGPDGTPHPVTGSFGVAVLSAAQTPAGLIKRADDGVYEAKHRGKNCVAIAP